MKLLVSAYACAPNRGSEHAVGWNWTTEAHKLGHEIWALVSPAHRDSIAVACRENQEFDGIRWIFPEVGGWRLQQGIEPVWERTYNLLWQRAALRHARGLQSRERFDAIHHLTWGGIRAPTFLGSLGPPLILGPLGGGETSPLELRDGFRFKARVTERIRDLSTSTIALNPLVRGGLAAAALISVKTPDTRRTLPAAMQQKSFIFFELGLHRTQVGQARIAQRGPLKLLYAGRLLYWKGVHIAIRAFAKLARHGPEARFTIVGKGPEEGRLKADVEARHLAERVEFIPWLPQQRLFDLYASHDLFVFPSLHDSSGTVVIEALSFGLPVVCLDLGGPRYIVTPDSGIVVGTAGRNTDEVAAAMADEILRLGDAPWRAAALSKGAIARAAEFLLPDRVKRFYEIVGGRIGVPRDKASKPNHAYA